MSNEWKDIKQVVKGNSRKGTFYLRKWYELQIKIRRLKGLELFMAKVLFSSLKELTEEERKILAAKYYREGIKPKDSRVAEQLNMEEKDYTNKRNILEMKLGGIAESYEIELKNER